MKKLAIMFVMLLGSVATMQAQTNDTFDFGCDTVNPLDLDGNGFEVMEEAALEAAVFHVANGETAVYNKDYIVNEGTHQDMYLLSIAADPAGGFNLTDDYFSKHEPGGFTNYDTIELALAAASIRIDVALANG